MTPTEQSAYTTRICQLTPIVPVLVIDDTAHAQPLAKALVAGGLPALEVTLRTPCALDAIRAMVEVMGSQVGAGTLRTPADVREAKEAGATFGVSPGMTEALLDTCAEYALPLLPGAATASEMMTLLEKGYTVQKFFPVEHSGGAAFLKSISAPLPQICFCPTGGSQQKLHHPIYRCKMCCASEDPRLPPKPRYLQVHGTRLQNFLRAQRNFLTRNSRRHRQNTDPV